MDARTATVLFLSRWRRLDYRVDKPHPKQSGGIDSVLTTYVSRVPEKRQKVAILTYRPHMKSRL